MTETKRHPLAIAWDKWIASEEGQKCRDVSTVHSDHYLENRLHRAFDAGAKVGGPIIKAAQEWRHDSHINNKLDLVLLVDAYEREVKDEQATTPKV